MRAFTSSEPQVCANRVVRRKSAVLLAPLIIFMAIRVSEKLNTLARACGFPLYLVGGAVRDGLAGLESGVTDIDICAPADTEAFVKAALGCGASVTAVYRNTGTVKLKFGEEEYEFTSFRSDEYTRGVHRPVNTFFTDDIRLDARRRDFKCNAVYYDIKSGEIRDPLGGVKDIKTRTLSTVAEAEKVFGEDGLRLMRLARQAAQTGFKPDCECMDGAARNARLITDISAERIYAELNAILHADEKYGVKYGQYNGLEILDKTRVLDCVLPELTAGRGMKQPEAFHSYDVLEHSLRAVKYAGNGVRLAALLHDIGKPYCKMKNGNYHGHEEESARISDEVCSRLKVPKKLAAETRRLCLLHMYDLRGDARESKIRKLIVKNHDIFDKLLMIKQADFSACRDNLSIAPCVTRWREIYGRMRDERVPFTVKELKANGAELIAAGVQPKNTGKICEVLLAECALDGALNKKERLIKRALDLQSNGDL